MRKLKKLTLVNKADIASVKQMLSIRLDFFSERSDVRRSNVWTTIRARQRFTGACRPISPDLVGARVAAGLKPGDGLFGASVFFRRAKSTAFRITPETNPLRYAFFCVPPTCLVSHKKRRKPMARVKRGTKRRARRKKYLKRTKAFSSPRASSTNPHRKPPIAAIVTPSATAASRSANIASSDSARRRRRTQ